MINHFVIPLPKHGYVVMSVLENSVNQSKYFGEISVTN